MNVGKPESDRDWVAGMAKPRLQLGRGGGGEIEVDGNVNIQMHFKIQMKKCKSKEYTQIQSQGCVKMPETYITGSQCCNRDNMAENGEIDFEK